MQITHIELNCSSAFKAEMFYTGKLGIPVQSRSHDSVSYKFGWSHLTFREDKTVYRSPQHFAFNIPQNQIDIAKWWLKERLNLVTNGDGQEEFEFESWGAKSVYFRDMDDNLVELIAREGFLTMVNGAWDTRQLACVSEIGVPTENVEGLANELKERCAIDGYKEVGPEFYPVGSKSGLLILVQTGRLWHPDFRTPAIPCPIKLRLQDEHMNRYTFKLGVEDGVFVHSAKLALD